MKISLFNCNPDIKQKLESFGYEISSEISEDTNALLYTGSLQNTFDLCKNASANGVFVINTTHKTPEEIDNILQKRLYSPIFFS